MMARPSAIRLRTQPRDGGTAAGRTVTNSGSDCIVVVIAYPGQSKRGRRLPPGSRLIVHAVATVSAGSQARPGRIFAGHANPGVANKSFHKILNTSCRATLAGSRRWLGQLTAQHLCVALTQRRQLATFARKRRGRLDCHSSRIFMHKFVSSPRFALRWEMLLDFPHAGQSIGRLWRTSASVAVKSVFPEPIMGIAPTTRIARGTHSSGKPLA